MKANNKTKHVEVLFIIIAVFFVLGYCAPVSYGISTKENKKIEISKIVTTDKSVKLYWTKIQNAKKYYIYRKSDHGRYKKIIEVNKSKQVYCDKTVKAGKRYTYKVVSKNRNKRYVSKKKSVTPIKLRMSQLQTVKRYSADSKDYAKIKWKSQKGYLYDILRKKENGAFVRI